MKKMTDYRSYAQRFELYDLQSHKKRCSQRFLVSHMPLAPVLGAFEPCDAKKDKIALVVHRLQPP